MKIIEELFRGSKSHKTKYPVSNLILATIITLLSLSSCMNKIPDEVDHVIRKAGRNRAQLTKVIDHYIELGDRQKLKAAYFLIENMEDKYGLYYPSDYYYFDILAKVDSLKKLDACEDLVDKLVKAEYAKHKQNGSDKDIKAVRDIEVITADYLINNIDLAFHVWKNKPWASHLTFDEFCEWILPYRVKTEPLQYWRKYFYENLENLLDTISNPESPIEAVKVINEYMAKDFQFTHTLGFMTVLGGIDLWRTKAGTCDQRYPLIVMALRSMGIPAAIDFTFQYPHFPGAHEWTVILDEEKKIQAFNGGEKDAKYFCPAACPIGNTFVFKVSTVFRHKYAINKNSLSFKLEERKIPENFRNKYIENVTWQYQGMNKQDIELAEISNNSEYLYLYVFASRNDVVPVSYARLRKDKVFFKDIGKAGVYFLGAFEEGKITMLGNPFIVPSDSEEIIEISTKTNEFEEVTLHRKYPTKYTMDVFIEKTIGAELQGSNFKDFREFEILYQVDHKIISFEEIDIKANKPFRYYRFISDSNEIRVADIQFFETKNDQKKKLTGKIYGHQSIADNCYETIYSNAFDDDIRTNFNAEAGSWAAMDMGKPVKLTQFKILVRNNQNVVEKGDTYELLYFDKAWKSLGTKTADDYYIAFENVPKGALLMLRDLTKGREERVFMYRNNTQDWWLDL